MASRSRRRTALLLLAAIAVHGCASSGPPAPTPPPARTESGLRPGDAVRVSIWREPSLSGEFTVDPSGVIVFPLIGDRTVTGIAIEDLESQVAEEYREYLVNPSVNITALRRVAILGEVRQPGLYPLDPTITLTEALALAGGVGPTGNKDDIRLIRDGQVLVQSLDAAQTIAQTPMQSGDQIEVGEQGWWRRNAAFISLGVVSITSIVAAMIISAGR